MADGTSVGLKVVIGPEWDRELKKLKATPKAVQRALQKEVTRMGIDIRNNAIRSMRKTPKTGRKYRSTKQRGIYHTASSPGYPPAVDTGDLIRSIVMDVRGSQITDFEVEVGSNITNPKNRYPRWLEEGTKFMDARPWLEPAVEVAKRKFYTTVRRNVNEAIRNAK